MMKKTICVKFDRRLKDADILRGCANALDHTGRQFDTDAKIDSIKIDRDACSVTMETTLSAPSFDNVMKDLRSIFNEMFSGVL